MSLSAPPAQTPIAEAPALRRQLPQPFAHGIRERRYGGPKHPEWGYGYTAALINYSFLAHAVWTASEVAKAMEHGS
jgi:hypothetical protein